MAEYVREEPLESELHDRMTTALQAVPGVTLVVQEDREVRSVDGTPGDDVSFRPPPTLSTISALAPRSSYRAKLREGASSRPTARRATHPDAACNLRERVPAVARVASRISTEFRGSEGDRR